MMRRNNLFLPILLVLAVLVLQGCLPGQAPPTGGAATQPASSPGGLPPTPTGIPGGGNIIAPTATSPHSPATQPLPGSGLDATYIDAFARLVINYPSGWNQTVPTQEAIAQSVIYSATFTSWQPSEAGPRGAPPPGTKFDLTVIKEPRLSFEDAVTQQKQAIIVNDANPDEIVSEEMWELAGGIPAVRWQVRSNMGEAALVLTVINGYTVLLAGYGDYELFDSIARTLRPLE